MDLLGLKLNLGERRARVTLRSAAGDAEEELAGEAFERVRQAAEPLLVRLAQEGMGLVRVVEIDALGETLSALCLGRPERLDRPWEQQLVRQRGGVNTGEVGAMPPHTTYLSLTGTDYRHAKSLIREPARVALREARPRKPDLPAGSDAELWEHKYRVHSDGWELMRPAPPLVRWLADHPPEKGLLALVPGCGRGHEARLLADKGVRVVAIDFAPTAIAETRRGAAAAGVASRVEARQADLFELARQPGEAGRYDLVLEHCCFCAVDPARRPEYVDAVATLLRPGGEFLGLFWCHDYAGGPPYGADPAEVEALFRRRFELRHQEVPADSIATRAGKELLLVMTKPVRG